MGILRKAVKVALPAAGVLTAFYVLDDESRFPLARRLSAFTNIPTKKSFDEHFPRTQWDYNWDFRAPEYLVSKKKLDAAVSKEEKDKLLNEVTSTATRNIFLIRHGQYHLDSEKKNLTPLGREQASLLGERLAASNINFDHLTMSTMVRAKETANLVLEHFPELKNTSCSLLEEGAPYPPEPMNKSWKPSYYEFYTDGARIESAFRRHIHRAPPKQTKDSYEIIVCHANVIRYFVCRALQFGPEGWLRISLGNCSITWLTIRPNGGVSIRGMGDIGYLPYDKISYT